MILVESYVRESNNFHSWKQTIKEYCLHIVTKLLVCIISQQLYRLLLNELLHQFIAFPTVIYGQKYMEVIAHAFVFYSSNISVMKCSVFFFHLQFIVYTIVDCRWWYCFIYVVLNYSAYFISITFLYFKSIVYFRLVLFYISV